MNALKQPFHDAILDAWNRAQCISEADQHSRVVGHQAGYIGQCPNGRSCPDIGSEWMAVRADAPAQMENNNIYLKPFLLIVHDFIHMHGCLYVVWFLMFFMMHCIVDNNYLYDIPI